MDGSRGVGWIIKHFVPSLFHTGGWEESGSEAVDVESTHGSYRNEAGHMQGEAELRCWCTCLMHALASVQQRG